MIVGIGYRTNDKKNPECKFRVFLFQFLKLSIYHNLRKCGLNKTTVEIIPNETLNNLIIKIL